MKNIKKACHSFRSTPCLRIKGSVFSALRFRRIYAASESSGRSMVEMLGVLAIIGVLSAGALAGYSKAMFRHKTNQTIEIFQNFLQRFAELEQKASGSEYFDIDGADDMVKYGLVDHCIKEPYRLGTGCRMPTGILDAYCEANPQYIRCGINIDFKDSKSCVAFASAHWENAVPVEWWTYPDDPEHGGGNIHISAQSGSYSIYNLHESNYDIVTQATMQGITDACAHCDEDGGCLYVLVVRSEP